MNIRTRRLALLVPAVAALLGMTGEPTSVVPAPREDAGAIARQDQLVSMVRDAKGPVPVLFVGDSITQGWNDPGKATWDAMIAPLGAMNLGNSGDRTENVLWRLQQAPLTKLSPRAIVLLIGTNNTRDTSEDIAAGVKAVLTKSRATFPGVKVILMSILPNARANEKMMAVNALTKGFADNGSVFYLDLAAKMTPAGDSWKGLGPDKLHLTPEGYELWAAELDPLLAKLL
jgi:lysophospholipase L1-like esterase